MLVLTASLNCGYQGGAPHGNTGRACCLASVSSFGWPTLGKAFSYEASAVALPGTPTAEANRSCPAGEVNHLMNLAAPAAFWALTGIPIPSGSVKLLAV